MVQLLSSSRALGTIKKEYSCRKGVGVQLQADGPDGVIAKWIGAQVFRFSSG